MNLILLVVALVFCILAAVNVGPPRVNLGWAGLACYIASLLVTGL